MRIGLFTHYIDKYPKNAPSLYQRDLIEKLVEKTNLEVVLIHHRKYNLPIYRLAEEAMIPRLPYLREREINKLDLDVIHFNAIPWSWWPTVSKLDIPSVVTVHGTIHWDDVILNDYGTLTLRAMKRFLEKLVVRYVTYFTAVSNHVRDVL
ncbi:MAG: glycosyltransferase, partial [Staphylothermus sp.]|nr:glycosyltransferase [Staphylothermus sp.]